MFAQYIITKDGKLKNKFNPSGEVIGAAYTLNDYFLIYSTNTKNPTSYYIHPEELADFLMAFKEFLAGREITQELIKEFLKR